MRSNQNDLRANALVPLAHLAALLCLVLPLLASADQRPVDEWFVQPAVTHLSLSPGGRQAAWLDLRDDAVRVRSGSLDRPSANRMLMEIPARMGLGLFRRWQLSTSPVAGLPGVSRR